MSFTIFLGCWINDPTILNGIEITLKISQEVEVYWSTLCIKLWCTVKFSGKDLVYNYMIFDLTLVLTVDIWNSQKLKHNILAKLDQIIFVRVQLVIRSILRYLIKYSSTQLYSPETDLIWSIYMSLVYFCHKNNVFKKKDLLILHFYIDHINSYFHL